MEQNENNFIEFINEKYGTIKIKIYIPHITLEKMLTNEPQENTTIIVKKRPGRPKGSFKKKIA